MYRAATMDQIDSLRRMRLIYAADSADITAYRLRGIHTKYGA